LDPRADPAQVLRVAQMREAEAALIAAGDSVESLMDRAGHGAAQWVHRIAAGRSVTVLCGPGNNGGDGYVIARELAAWGNRVQVVAPLPPRTAAAIAARAACPVAVIDGIPADLPQGDIMVDALFGAGLTRAVEPDLLALLCALMAGARQSIAIDVPSGIDSDSGAVLNEDLPPFALTLALGAWKPAHFAMPGCARMGALRLVDIGCAAVPGAARVLPRPVFAAPAADAHKYRRGLATIVGGAMPGAALLAAGAARHAGAGYVRLAALGDCGAVLPDLVVLRQDPAQALADGRSAAVLVGPGLGRDAAARAALRAVLSSGVPAVVDADALHLLRPGMAAAVLTPHQGELVALERAYRLAGQGTRADRALALARASGAVVLAKGPDSALAAPDGRVLVAPRASSWLSVAGSGDVLAGLVVSRLAVRRDAFAASAEALWLHGEAARLAGPAFCASELADRVRAALGAAA